VPPQVIPRPPGARPGTPAPWEGLAAGRRSGLALDRVRHALQSGFDRERTAAPRESAVLAALFDESGETRVVLTRRSSTLRSHRSEVSFPGGRVEEGETLVAAALREAWEEVALDPGTVEVIGMLSALTTVSSRALIQPFIGVLASRPSLRANPHEVERAFDVALADLLADGVYRSERWGFGGGVHDMHFFELPGDIVWGATGRMLWELLGRVTGTVVHPGPEGGPLP